MKCRNCGTDIGDDDGLSLCPKCYAELTKEVYTERLRLLQPKPLMFADATLRDWFAGHVDVEIDIPIAQAEQIAGRKCPSWQTDYLGNVKFWAEIDAIVRGIYADAKIAERNKGGGDE